MLQGGIVLPNKVEKVAGLITKSGPRHRACSDPPFLVTADSSGRSKDTRRMRDEMSVRRCC